MLTSLRDDQGLFTTARDQNATAPRNSQSRAPALQNLDSYVLNVQQNHFNKALSHQDSSETKSENSNIEIRNKLKGLNLNYENPKRVLGIF
jgi:hypothetical protein